MGEKRYLDIIDKKKVWVILNLNKYSFKTYAKEFQEWVDYQKGTSLTGEKGEVYFKRYKDIKSFEPIPYDSCFEVSAKYFARVIFELLKNEPHFMQSDELDIQIKVIKEEFGSFAFDDKASGEEDACYKVGGKWFIQNFAAPYFYYNGRIDWQYPYRFLTTQLSVYKDFCNRLIYETTHELKIKRLAKRASATRLNYLYNTMFNLREEGLADFLTRKGSDRLEIDMDGVHKFQLNLGKLTNMKRAKEFWESTLDFGNLTNSGVFYNGRLMCQFIAMSLAKDEHKPYTVIVRNESHVGSSHDLLDKWLSNNDKIYVMNLTKSVLDEAIDMISKTQHYLFIKMYEQACDNLRIGTNNRVITSHIFFNLKKATINVAAEAREERLRKRGFVPVQSPVE